MLYTAEKQPAVFFATCARLIGPEVKLTIEQQLPGNLSPADWNLMMQILDAVKSAIPDAANRPAGEVLEFVLGVLRNCFDAQRRLVRANQSAQGLIGTAASTSRVNNASPPLAMPSGVGRGSRIILWDHQSYVLKRSGSFN